jgi:hypothetical protein
MRFLSPCLRKMKNWMASNERPAGTLVDTDSSFGNFISSSSRQVENM